jgi:hypothetical protein
MSDNKRETENQETAAGETKQHLAGGFPTVSLQKAIALMKTVWEKEKRNAAPQSAILEHWEYGAKSSGGFQAIATLKRFGLLQAVNNGTSRALKVSDMALNLLKYEETDPAAYRKQLKSLALLPAWYQTLWDRYKAELPSDKPMESFLVFDNHMPDAAAKLLIKTYKETILFAKLTEGDNIGESKPPINEVGEEKDQKPPIVNTMDLVIKSGELPIPIGNRVALVPFPMGEDDFDLFVETLKLWKKKLVKKATATPPKIKLPANATWSNNNHDKPVKIVAIAGEHDGELYYTSEDGTGIPVSQLKF